MAGYFAEVYLNLETSQINSPFDYSVPDSLVRELKPGSFVLVPFGQRLETGFVTKIKQSSAYKEISGSTVKEIKDVLLKKPIFNADRLKIAYWLSYYYFSPMSSVLRLFLPPGYNLKINRLICFAPERKDALLREFPVFSGISNEECILEKKLIGLLSEKSNLQPPGIKKLLFKIEKEKYAKVSYRLSESKIRPKFIDIYDLNPQEYSEPGQNLQMLKNTVQENIVEYIKNHPGSMKKEILAGTQATEYGINALLKRKIIIKSSMAVKRDFNYDSYLKNTKSGNTIILNSSQENCINRITEFTGKNVHHNFLIEGVTGSGKTEVYIRCAEDALKKRKSVLVLTPEISLTPQLYSSFKNVFPRGVAVYHSGMSDNEKYEKWLDILEGEIKIIIGTRSALFTPVQDLGLIIIDEEHDTSYKENSGIRYNAIDTAMRLGRILKIPVVFGSATPSIALKYNFGKRKDSTILSMPEKIYIDTLTAKEIVDLKTVNKNIEDEVITNRLFDEIKKSVDNNEKVIIFINRRGYSTFAVCSDCGFIPKCSNCDLPYTFHKSGIKLKCHHCGSEESFIFECPACKSRRISLYGTGIQKVESKLKQRFSDIPVIRMDSDITSMRKSHEEILNKFISQSPAILIGTQMVSKGLDIEDVTLVGVINIDGMMSLPDYHMNERAFSMLTQVSGRTGRSSRHGKVIVQTFRPGSIVIKNFINNRYEDFYFSELQNRKELDYPPYSSLINIIISCKDQEKAKTEACRLYGLIKPLAEKDNNKLLGPSPAPFMRLNQYYRWHILLKTFKMNMAICDLKKILAGFKIDKDCRLIIDVDPVWIL